jgi:deazaflavin-dependent oxidoreductase (nitroreductase family)
MTQMSYQQERLLRQGFKQLNRLMLLQWRLGMGKYISFWPEGVGQFVVLVHTGRKTGLQRRTPVNFAAIDGDIYVTAGFGKVAHWYRNIITSPEIEIWHPDGWWAAVAEDVTGGENQLPIMRAVLQGSGFAARMAGINPDTISDAELARQTAAYRLLRIRRTAARTGKGGPGDLDWVWPLLVHLLLPLFWWQNRRLKQAR